MSFASLLKAVLIRVEEVFTKPSKELKVAILLYFWQLFSLELAHQVVHHRQEERLGEASRDPCIYPHFTERMECAFDTVENDKVEDQLSAGWVCDPENTISMSELYTIDNAVRKIYDLNKNNCQCPDANKGPLCWYKFAFAFLRDIHVDIDWMRNGGWQCARGNGSLSLDPPIPEVSGYDDVHQLPSAELAYLFAQNYARMLRKQWNIGNCGEDILFLVVQNPPRELLKPQNRIDALTLRPNKRTMVFVSFGSKVREKFLSVVPHSMVSLETDVADANSQISSGYPFAKVLSTFLLPRLSEALKRVERSSNKKSQNTFKSHIPFWAWIVFGVCGLSLVLMSAGLFMLRQKTNRRTFGKHNMNARRWNPTGDEQSVSMSHPAPIKVNLLQILMPSPKPALGGISQQV